MVRFIILFHELQLHNNFKFTFQYGQIYYPSNEALQYPIILFTFQYGQIYYYDAKEMLKYKDSIYIPIWLDLLLDYYMKEYNLNQNLHSNMVRFIIII